MTNSMLNAVQVIIDYATGILRGVMMLLTTETPTDNVAKVVVHLRAVTTILAHASEELQKEISSNDR